jgi:hypothetical protein
MKKIIAICVLIACVFLGSCAKVETQEQISNKETASTSMFISVEATDTWRVVYHKETKVMYAVSRGYYNCGTFTLLVNADGTPMIWEGGQ